MVRVNAVTVRESTEKTWGDNLSGVNADLLRKVTVRAQREGSHDAEGIKKQVNSIKHRVLIHALETAQLGFGSVTCWVMDVWDANDNEVLRQLIDKFQKLGLKAEWHWADTKINQILITVSWATEDR